VILFHPYYRPDAAFILRVPPILTRLCNDMEW
jgi:hypothetical protein